MSARDSDTANGFVAAALAVMLCACAHSAIDPRERLAWYREHAGPPVAGFDYVRNMRWEAIGDQALAVWPRRDAGFLLEMASPCPGLDEARAIQISHADGRVRSRADSVRVLSLPGSPPLRRPACPILIITSIQAPTGAPAGLRAIQEDDGA